ncbi:MAG: hypothetical protein M3P53_13355 [Actinomycetota bacterium]|nr:hypothetical protein [Actinomycetota bacterium]
MRVTVARHTEAMGVRHDCRHYSTRTTTAGVVQRCRLGVHDDMPFACPEGCVFFEARTITGVGWQRFDDGSGQG